MLLFGSASLALAQGTYTQIHYPGAKYTFWWGINRATDFIPGVPANPSAAAAVTPQDSKQPSPAPTAAAPPAREGQSPHALNPDSAQAAPSDRKALIYVLRKGSMVGALLHPIIFVNDYLLAEIHNSNYAELNVAAGVIVLTETSSNSGDTGLFGNQVGPNARVPGNPQSGRGRVSKLGFLQMPSPTGEWASLPGCLGLDWRRLAAAPSADRELCYKALVELNQECGSSVTKSGQGGRIVTTTWSLPACNSKLGGSGDAVYLLDLALNPGNRLHEALRIEVEAGKTYYVEWSAGKMKMIDPAKGAKEIRGLHPAWAQ